MSTNRIAVVNRVPKLNRVGISNRQTAKTRNLDITYFIGDSLMAYYRADTTSIILTSGKVSQWNDISGNGLHALQGTSTRRPVVTTNWANSASAITFASGNLLRVGSLVQTTTQPWTMGGVFQCTDLSAGRSIFCPAAAAGGDYLSIRSSGVANREINTNGVGAISDGAATTNIEVWIATGETFVTIPSLVLHKLFTSTTNTAQTLNTPATAVSAPSGGQAFIGAITATGTQPFIGSIGELFFINRLMTTDEMTRYLLYVTQRYGII